jgi:hypothetical protein
MKREQTNSLYDSLSLYSVVCCVGDHLWVSILRPPYTNTMVSPPPSPSFLPLCPHADGTVRRSTQHTPLSTRSWYTTFAQPGLSNVRTHLHCSGEDEEGDEEDEDENEPRSSPPAPPPPPAASPTPSFADDHTRRVLVRCPRQHRTAVTLECRFVTFVAYDDDDDDAAASVAAASVSSWPPPPTAPAASTTHTAIVPSLLPDSTIDRRRPSMLRTSEVTVLVCSCPNTCSHVHEIVFQIRITPLSPGRVPRTA